MTTITSQREYDLVIVGAGIAGLRVGIEALKANRALKCCILEKYNYTGGRVVTYHKDISGVGHVFWENGAGRISEAHHKILDLLKEYKLTFIPISSSLSFINGATNELHPEEFTGLIPSYLGVLYSLDRKVLGQHTLVEILEKVHGAQKAREFFIQFPYYSEIHTLRADLALDSFKHEMSTNSGYGVCKGGLSELIRRMVADFEKRGGHIILNTEVTSVMEAEKGSSHVVLKTKNSGEFVAKKGCVLALHHAALKGIKGVNRLAVLDKLKMEPLLRMYCVFGKNSRGKMWFDDLPKIVADDALRYIIPIDAKKGTIMISYTDGKDTAKWFKIKDDKEALRVIMTEIRRIFPDRDIPEPLFFKRHPWYDGCTYWLPGDYDPLVESNKSLWPLPDKISRLFMCGESFAVRQAWMEGAIEQADKLLAHSAFKPVRVGDHTHSK